MKLKPLKEKDQKKAAKEFADFWKDKGYEKGQSQPFWISLLRNVYGVEEPEKVISFEDQVMLDHTSFIDGTIPDTKVLIEQKSLDKDLGKAIKQSDGTYLTPFQQAKRYSAELPYSKRPRWIVVSNFAEFRIYDMEKPTGEPEIIYLKDLPKEYYRLNFLIDAGNENIKKEMEISLQAGTIVGGIYDALLKEYIDPDDPKTLESLNVLCVRLVFLLYAEDAGLLGSHMAFHDYLERHRKDARNALIKLFKVLDTKDEDRDPYDDEDLNSFPYINGGLFADENIIIPRLSNVVLNLILKHASEDFDWSTISPTIFGAVFESTLNPETRRTGGMHYTSIENIHKVIDPLFLDDLKDDLAKIKELKTKDIRDKRLLEFQKKISSLTFLDPACGSGNFLTETYLSLRKLENEVLFLLNKGQRAFYFLEEDVSPIKVSIEKFNGIEINDFAVTVAKTALWIAESQMLKETEELLAMDIDFFPLKTQANIIEGNASMMDWNEVVSKEKLSFIMGNPPFVGKKEMSVTQKNELSEIFNGIKGCRNIDYVSAWYAKTLDYIDTCPIQTAFVSTNSITQGEQVPIIWDYLLSKKIVINFAYRTFEWDSESTSKAHVHCVIIGFSRQDLPNKYIYETSRPIKTSHINPYLVSGPDCTITSSKEPISKDVPKISYGSMPIDDGHLILDKEDVEMICNSSPELSKYCRSYIGGNELINNKKRYCLWLVDAKLSDIRRNNIIRKRIERCKEFRENSNRKQTNKLADTPWLFGEIRQPDAKSIVIPKVSSQTRRYIPMDFIENTTIINGSALIVHSSNLYHFAILSSNVHMAWMRTVAGRMKSDYQYSSEVVYNNFPWPDPTPQQRSRIEKTAQAILDARDLYPDSSLADLYDELTMPPELRKAHQENDKAVMAAYGFNVKTMTESQCVQELFKLYADKVKEL